MADFGRKGDAKLILALAAGETIRDAARAAGIGERTAHRRMESAEFRRRVEEARSQFLDSAIGKLADTAAEAVTCLRDLLHANSEPVRLGAARAVLEYAAKLHVRPGADQDSKSDRPAVFDVFALSPDQRIALSKVLAPVFQGGKQPCESVDESRGGKDYIEDPDIGPTQQYEQCRVAG